MKNKRDANAAQQQHPGTCQCVADADLSPGSRPPRPQWKRPLVQSGGPEEVWIKCLHSPRRCGAQTAFPANFWVQICTINPRGSVFGIDRGGRRRNGLSKCERSIESKLPAAAAKV
eukprot:363080-Chlamydomonas_euryale.AAC.3